MNRRPLRALLTANAVSITGTAMTLLAIPWFVLATTGSAGKTGISAACETIPLVLMSAFGAPLIDQLGPRRVAITSDLLSAVGISLIPILHLTTGVTFWQLCLVIGATGLARAPGDTARYVLLPRLVELAGTPIERATSAFDGVSRGARMLGTPIAGALIAAIGPAQVLFVDGASFVLSGILICTLVPRVEVEPSEELPYLRKLREGLSAVRQDRLVLAIVSMVLVTNLLDAAWATVFAPVYAREVLHSSLGLGLMFSTFGLGALTGTVVYGVVGPRLPRWPVYATAFLAVGAPRFLLLGLAPPLVVILGVSVLLGFLCGAINPILSAVEYERIPPALQSRVFGVTAAGCLVGMPAGSLLAGQAVEHVGLKPAIFGAAAVYLLVTLSPFVFRVWREMERSAPTGPDLLAVADECSESPQHIARNVRFAPCSGDGACLPSADEACCT
ncbi:MAG: putative arabinose efflux permease, family [Frankiales bacterium]|nr:putative arabinose efflux permease, family [Frankiales bacterium]